MNKANIAYTRNHLSQMLARVKSGETIVIMDRDEAVARLEPITGPAAPRADWRASLARRGLVRPARQALDVTVLGRLPLPRPGQDADILQALLADREEGR